jgi:hypothetical protein
VSDSGPNLGVRAVGCLLVVAGLLLVVTAYRIHKGTSRLRVSGAAAIFAVGAFTVGGAVVGVLGAILLGAGS